MPAEPQKVIDVFCHWMPLQYYRRVQQVATIDLHMLHRAHSIAVMSDLAARIAFMEQLAGYQQLPCLVSPPIEALAGPDKIPKLAQVANDGLAAMVAASKNCFPAFVASLPMNNPKAALKEAERAIHQLGACGVQIFTQVNGRPLDREEFMPIFAAMAEFDRPIWLHPARGMNQHDYRTEPFSKYEIWWALGWLYETSVAMLRLVFAGVFDRWPNLKIITHHAGAFIPAAEGRLGPGLDALGARTPQQHKEEIQTSLQARLVDALKKFYTDTATFGSKASLQHALEFFAADHLLFASDFPFGPDSGTWNVQATLAAIEQINVQKDDKQKIYSRNIKKLLDLTC